MQIMDSASEATAIMKGTPPRMRKETWNSALKRLIQLGKSLPSGVIDQLDDVLPHLDGPLADGGTSAYLNRIPAGESTGFGRMSADGMGAEDAIERNSDVAPSRVSANFIGNFQNC